MTLLPNQDMLAIRRLAVRSVTFSDYVQEEGVRALCWCWRVPQVYRHVCVGPRVDIALDTFQYMFTSRL